MKKSEMEIIKQISVDLGDDIIFVMTKQYHTEKDENDPAGKKNDKKKSRYRMLGFVDTVSNVEKKIKELRSDGMRLLPWKWTDDPSWDGDVMYSKNANNMAKASWLRNKIKKMMSPEEAVLKLKGFKKNTDEESPTFGQYCVFNKNSVFDIDGYSCSDGNTVNILDFDILKTKIGQNIWKEIHMKTLDALKSSN